MYYGFTREELEALTKAELVDKVLNLDSELHANQTLYQSNINYLINERDEMLRYFGYTREEWAQAHG